MQTQSVSQVMPLMSGLLKLSHVEKLRVVNILLREIAAEEGVSLEPGGAEAGMQENDLDQLLGNSLKAKDFKQYKPNEMIEPANTRLADFLAFIAEHRIQVSRIDIPNRDERNAR
jgi:hypothetical protein